MENQEDKNANYSVNQPSSSIQNVSESYINQTKKNSPSINSSVLKKYFLYILIGGLVVSALISISAILIGEFNSFVLKALGTTFLIVVHSLFALAFIRVNNRKSSIADEILTNVIFGITVLSLMTSVFTTWEIIGGIDSFRLYLLYFYAFVGALICRALLGVQRVDLYTKNLSNSGVVLTIVLFFLLIPSIFYPQTVSEFYWRVVAAMSVLLGTVSVLAAITDRLFLNKHPEMNQNKHESKFVRVLMIIGAIIVGSWIIQALFLIMNSLGKR